MAEPDDRYDYDDDVYDGGCPQCGGEGFVADCFEEYACIDPEGGCAECLVRCDYCRPPNVAGSGAMAPGNLND